MTPVDVIVPVYGAADELQRCLASVVRHTDLSRHRLMLVLDGPQDEAVERVVAAFRATVLRNVTRLGFAASVNRGMGASSHDVVLLNSDTVVTARWLEKMIAAASSAENVGTVTPLSNNATLCSVPRAFEENLLPTGHDVDSFAALVESRSSRTYPRLPTGVGFCLFIRRALLDDIGLFDAQRFADGYGEENDFCCRALERGWVHVADDATFVHHAGHRSFGASRAPRQRRAARVLARRHPRYMATVAAFMRDDPLRAMRDRLDDRGQGDLRIVHVVHGWPPFQNAGTELYAYWLVRRQRERHRVAVYTRGADPARGDGEAVELLDDGVRVRIMTNHFRMRDPLRRNAIRSRALDRDFERFLRDERPHLVHIHHLAGHAFSLARVARRLGIPIVMQLQDWWFLCARVNRLARDGTRCSGPAPARCAACATLTKIAGANRIVHLLRRREARAALSCASAFVAGSEAIRRDYESLVPRTTPFHVLPYGIAVDEHREERAVRAPLRFGYVGSIAPHKGLHTAVEAMRGVDATLHVWGDRDANPHYVASLRAGANVIFEGRFAEEEKAKVFASMDVLLVPSIGLESFGLAAREAMACGVPVIATSGGALDELEEAERFPPGDVEALRAILQRLDAAEVERRRARLPRPKRADEHAREIEGVYRSVLS